MSRHHLRHGLGQLFMVHGAPDAHLARHCKLFARRALHHAPLFLLLWRQLVSFQHLLFHVNNRFVLIVA